MLNRSKTIHPAVVYAILSGVSHAIEKIAGDSVVIGSAGFLFTLIFAAASIFSLVEYLADWIADTVSRIRESETITREGVLAARLAILNPEALAILRELIQGEVLGDAGPGAYYNGTFVPDSFIRELISGSSGNYLAAERLWSEGSNGRRYYRAVAGYLIGEGIAIAARGNKPVEITRPWREVLEVLRKAETVAPRSRSEAESWIKI